MPLDIDKYMHHLDGMDLTTAQKRDYIRVVHGFMEGAVDQAFGRHPVQLARGCYRKSNLQSPGESIDSKRSVKKPLAQRARSVRNIERKASSCQ